MKTWLREGWLINLLKVPNTACLKRLEYSCLKMWLVWYEIVHMSHFYFLVKRDRPENKYHLHCHVCEANGYAIELKLVVLKSSLHVISWDLLWLLSLWSLKMRVAPDELNDSSVTNFSCGISGVRGILWSLLFIYGGMVLNVFCCCGCLSVLSCSGQPWHVWAMRRLACCSTLELWPVR